MDEAYTRLLKAARERVSPPSGKTAIDGGPWFTKVSLSIPDCSILHWLSAQPVYPKYYWSSRDGTFESAGLGTAFRVLAQADPAEAVGDVFALMTTLLNRSDPGTMLFGGHTFAGDHDSSRGHWQAFGDMQFILPRIELQRNAECVTLSCYLDHGKETESLEDLSRLVKEATSSNEAPDGPIHAPVSRTDTPSRDEWDTIVSNTLDEFEKGELEKVVLARNSSFQFDEALTPLRLLQRLKQVTPQCFHFCLQLNASLGFLGASPERLYRRQGVQLESEAVAGTRPRSPDADEDARLADELLSSEKDLREHRFVRDAIEHALAPVSTTLTVSDNVSLLQLARGQHLYHAFSASLEDRVYDDALLKRLHPTPAVGGTPTEAACRHISKSEPFDRGWYAGPVGWVTREAAEFAVAIRSAVVDERSLSLFSGAGIVRGSTPDSEWQEIEHKISDFIRILTEQ